MFRRLFCRHKRISCISNFYGDAINDMNCRSLWECDRCKKLFMSDNLCSDCKYINFHPKETFEKQGNKDSNKVI